MGPCGARLQAALALQGASWHHGQRSLIMIVAECLLDDERSSKRT